MQNGYFVIVVVVLVLVDVLGMSFEASSGPTRVECSGHSCLLLNSLVGEPRPPEDSGFPQRLLTFFVSYGDGSFGRAAR